MKIVARIYTDFPEKFGIPRQSGLADALTATVVFEPEYRNADALRGLEDFSHIWLIWQFSEAVRDNWSPTVRPPRLGGNTRMGVFATRSPFRPTPIGLSSVRLREICYDTAQGPVLIVEGADLMDGTPIYDITPSLPITDCHTDAKGGFSDEKSGYSLQVIFPESLQCCLPAEKLTGLQQILSQDPRPAYQDDPAREYTVSYAGFRLVFQVEKDVLTVKKVEKE